MFTGLMVKCAFAALICIALGTASNPAVAVTAEVAKQCRALTARAYPPRQVGNPAAGSAKGTGRAEQSYFNSCVANGGKMDDNGAKQAK